jgi:hypothetical protein
MESYRSAQRDGFETFRERWDGMTDWYQTLPSLHLAGTVLAPVELP